MYHLKLIDMLKLFVSVSHLLFPVFCFFFFQAEDGIRDPLVTGVQTCALPILNSVISRPHSPRPRITRRNSVSVTPAIGASTAAGRIAKSRIWRLFGNMESSRPIPV